MLPRLFPWLMTVVILMACNGPTKDEPAFDPLPFVEPNIGSVHGRWFFYTPAAVPFGMAKLAPHTNAYEGVGSWLPQGYDDRHRSTKNIARNIGRS